MEMKVRGGNGERDGDRDGDGDEDRDGVGDEDGDDKGDERRWRMKVER